MYFIKKAKHKVSLSQNLASKITAFIMRNSLKGKHVFVVYHQTNSDVYTIRIQQNDSIKS